MGVELKTSDLIADSFFPEGSECDALQQYWDSGAMPEGLDPLELLRDIEVEAEPEAGTDICFSMEAPSWYVGFSEGFLKSVTGIDRKLQGRILEAVSKIGRSPTTPMGDTIKPLGGELAGLWRYRLGDCRLLYRPDPCSRHVTLVSFGPRGAIYD